MTDSDDLISGIVNFGNSAGFSEFEISHDRKKSLVVRIEVFPSKISYKEDYQNMLQDISNEIAGAVLGFMRNTYQEFSIGSTQNTIPALFFEIIKRIFDKFQNAANTIIASPHHKLYVEHPVVPAHKVKKIDNQTIKWLQKHPEHVVPMAAGYSAVKAPTVKKQITYNTLENQFTKFILKSTSKKLKDFRDRYVRSTRKPEDAVLNSVDTMTSALNKLVNGTFLREVDDYRATQSMSLVFEMAPGYRELYKYYLMMQRGLSVHGDVFRMSLKDTAQLYEYWCFIKLVTLMKRNYRLASSDVIKVDHTGVTISLVKGKKSEVKFVNPSTGEQITLSYNPGEQNTQTVNQRPDNVLTLEKKGSDVPYKYVFDAKYRIENNPSDPFYPDTKPGPRSATSIRCIGIVTPSSTKATRRPDLCLRRPCLALMFSSPMTIRTANTRTIGSIRVSKPSISAACPSFRGPRSCWKTSWQNWLRILPSPPLNGRLCPVALKGDWPKWTGLFGMFWLALWDRWRSSRITSKEDTTMCLPSMSKTAIFRSIMSLCISPGIGLRNMPVFGITAKLPT